MKVLVVVKSTPPQKYLVHLPSKESIAEVRNLINNNKHSKAVTTVFIKGVFEREVLDHELHDISADLILSDCNARWDLT